MRPVMTTWIEEADEFRSGCLSVDPGEVRALMVVAVEAGEGEVSKNRWASVLPRDDVFDLEKTRV
jgi:hypothetical protein